MGGFLRLQVYGPALSDEEFIAAVREAAKARRVFQPRPLLGNYVLLLGALLAVMLPLWLARGFSGRLPDWLDAGAPAAVGALLGVVPGFLIAWGLKMAREALLDRRQQRLARLLLKYHDAVADKGTKETSGAEGKRSSPPAGAGRPRG